MSQSSLTSPTSLPPIKSSNTHQLSVTSPASQSVTKRHSLHQPVTNIVIQLSPVISQSIIQPVKSSIPYSSTTKQSSNTHQSFTQPVSQSPIINHSLHQPVSLQSSPATLTRYQSLHLPARQSVTNPVLTSLMTPMTFVPTCGGRRERKDKCHEEHTNGEKRKKHHCCMHLHRL